MVTDRIAGSIVGCVCVYMSVKVLSHTATLCAVAFTVYTPVLVNGVQLRKFTDIKYRENKKYFCWQSCNIGNEENESISSEKVMLNTSAS